MMARLALTAVCSMWPLMHGAANGGVLDPDCTAEKSAAVKATVGVGGRCTAGQAARDTAKRSAGIEEKGPIEKRRDDDDRGLRDKVRK